MSDIDSDKWLEAMKSEMDSMGSTSLDPRRPTQGVRPVGCKWVYKRKLGANGGLRPSRPGSWRRVYSTTRVDFEETYSPVAMAKSIRILLAIAAWYDYKIWQMDVKTAFLNGFVEERSLWISWKVSLLLEKNRVVSKGPSMASSKLSKVGTRILMKSYGVMILSRTTMILVYTRRSVGARL
ncbi:UNVERIFIED_CONTAM: hypothetical protein Slati_2170300 [Sesamum latifolium]|uniref:Reverse transcriptase Ty1/copia-type domain-containing protein n=1 Tax=Sesamum latifolium TaxID=2727402 RepID=A0AAW2WWY6_9LAMI